MADTTIVKTGAGGTTTGLVGDGATAVAHREDPNVYRQTPKYGDPQSGPTENKLARFKFSADFAKQIASASSTAGVSVSANDAILKKLTGQGYIEFFLQNVDESFEDRFQIVETLGDTYAVFGIGKKPRIFSFSGALYNSVENDWRINFIRMFENYLSISKLAKYRGATTPNIVGLRYDTVFLQGAILSLRTNLQASNELATAFSFAMLVTKFDIVDTSNLPTTAALPEVGSNSGASANTPDTRNLVLTTTPDDSLLVLSGDSFAKGTA